MSEETEKATEKPRGELGGWGIDYNAIDETDNGEQLVDALMSEIVSLVTFGTRNDGTPIDNVKRDVSKAREAVETRIYELAHALDDTRNDRRNIVKELDDAHDTIAGKIDELRNADKSIDALASTLDDAQARLRVAAVSYAQLEHQHEQRGVQLDAVNQKLVQTTDELETKRRQLDAAERSVTQLEQRLADAETTIGQLGRKIAGMNDQVARQSQEHAAAIESRDELAARLDVANQQHVEEIRARDYRIKQLEQQLDALKKSTGRA